jgi:hypothetical protein
MPNDEDSNVLAQDTKMTGKYVNTAYLPINKYHIPSSPTIP